MPEARHHETMMTIIRNIGPSGRYEYNPSTGRTTGTCRTRDGTTRIGSGLEIRLAGPIEFTRAKSVRCSVVGRWMPASARSPPVLRA